jgi:hypothetical protein
MGCAAGSGATGRGAIFGADIGEGVACGICIAVAVTVAASSRETTAGAGMGPVPGFAALALKGGAMPGNTLTSAARNAAADWKRACGSLAMAIRMISFRSAGMPGTKLTGGAGIPCICADMIW